MPERCGERVEKLPREHKEGQECVEKVPTKYRKSVERVLSKSQKSYDKVSRIYSEGVKWRKEIENVSWNFLESVGKRLRC